MLSFEGWFDGLSALFILLFGIIFGFYQVRYSKVYNTKLLFYFGLSAFFIGLNFLSLILDFFVVISFGRNFNIPTISFGPYNSNPILCLLSFMWLFPAIYSASVVAGELVAPKIKKYLYILILILGVIYELFLFFGPNSYTISSSPPIEGEDLIDNYIIFGSPPSIISFFFIIFLWIFLVLGAIYRSLQAKGLIRKKLLYIAVGVFLVSLGAIFDSLSAPNIYLMIFRPFFVIGLIIVYIGLKPQKKKERKKKKPSEALIKLASYMVGKPKSEETVSDSPALIEKLETKLLLFLSYATKDVDTFNIHGIAKLLSDLPEIEKVLYWEEDMEDNIFEYMDENLEKCNAMLLFCSEHSKDSVPVKKEWTAAEAIGLPIIPVFYEVNHIPTLLKSRLGLEYDFYDMERNIQELKNLILKKVGGLVE
ncbi:MAG: toll/interleukin-1 receptor domain-containing protein [Promethearchaeota archaeon]